MLSTQSKAESITYILDSRATTDDSDKRIFRSAKAALSALSDGTAEEPTILKVYPGVYWLDDPDDPSVRMPKDGDDGVPYAAELRCNHLRIEGMGEKSADVVWAVNRGQTQGAYGNYTMLKVVGRDITCTGMTFGNYCNVDLEYPSDPTLNRPKRAEAIVQAQIAICHEGSDRLYFKNCRFVSRLNLCPFVGARRVLYEKCHFESTDDALCGTGLYVDCDFLFCSGKPFYSTSRTGVVMINCDIKSLVSGTQYFTKAGGQLALIDCRIDAPKVSKIEWSKGDEPYICYTYNTTLNGRPMNIDTERGWRTVELRKGAGLEAYICADGTYNIAGLTAADDGWNPTRGHGQTYATMMCITPNTIDTRAGGEEVTMRADEYRWGAATPIATHTVTKKTTNDTWRDEKERYVHDTDNGLRAMAVINVRGTKVETPTLRTPPTLSVDRRSDELRLNYKIGISDKTDAIGNEDVSLVTWYRIDKKDTIALKESRDGWAKNVYQPTRADRRHKILARIVPQIKAGVPSKPIYTSIRTRHYDERTEYIHTDFSDVPIVHSSKLNTRGAWLMDANKPKDTEQYDWQAQSSAEHPAWRYGQALDGAQGNGLITERRGARLTYNPAETKCQKMAVKILIDPCKSAGQGFGSATGQYLDIKIKHDVNNGRAYGLRIERTPEHDKAVVVTPMNYTANGAEPLSAGQVYKSFKTGCEIVVVSDGKNLRISLSREEDKPLTIDAETDGKLRSTGLQMQHTGSTGASALMIHSIDISID